MRSAWRARWSRILTAFRGYFEYLRRFLCVELLDVPEEEDRSVRFWQLVDAFAD